jgi:hypothetical protein
MPRVTNAVSRNESLTKLALSYGDHKLSVKIVCLLVKQKAGKEQHPLSPKERLVKSLQL